jgi:hypothetical protein
MAVEKWGCTYMPPHTQQHQHACDSRGGTVREINMIQARQKVTPDLCTPSGTTQGGRLAQQSVPTISCTPCSSQCPLPSAFDLLPLCGEGEGRGVRLCVGESVIYKKERTGHRQLKLIARGGGGRTRWHRFSTAIQRAIFPAREWR